MILSALRFIGRCVLIAVLVYTIYLVHIELLRGVFRDGYDFGQQTCIKESDYLYPQDEYEGV